MEREVEALSKIKLPELALQSSDSVTLTKPSPISQQNGLAVLKLMKETKDNYINQELPETTQKMYLAQWTRMVQRYGLEEFRGALLTVIQVSKFFPPPEDIREVCASRAYGQGMRRSAQKAIRELDEAKALWERQRAEDRAAKENAA
jgi:hypothetical protein